MSRDYLNVIYRSMS